MRDRAQRPAGQCAARGQRAAIPSYDQLGLFALVEMVVFILTVFVAYAYVWRRGGLTWD